MTRLSRTARRVTSQDQVRATSAVCDPGRISLSSTTMSEYPTSPKEMTKGMMYFPRMLDKIRRHGRGELPEEYHANLGRPKTADGTCTNFLRVNYGVLRER